MIDQITAMRWAAQHLRLRLHPIHRALRGALEHLASGRGEATDRTGAALVRLSRLDQLIGTGRTTCTSYELSSDEILEDKHIRDRARADGVTLPLDRLRDELSLSDAEIETLLLCMALELDGEYAPIVARLHGDEMRRRISVQLATSLMTPGMPDRFARRAVVSRLGTLRRRGLLRVIDSPIELESELVLAPEALTDLIGQTTSRFADPLEVSDVESADLPVTDLVTLVRGRTVSTVGIWGGTSRDRLRTACAIASGLGRSLRRPWEPFSSPSDIPQALQLAARDAEVLDAVLWIDGDALADDVLDHALASTRARTIISARHPRRPPRLVARGFAEVVLAAPSFEARRTMWREAVPELSDAHADSLAGRYRLDRTTIQAAAALAITTGLDRAAAAMAQPHSLRFADVIAPHRRFDELILPPNEERAVRELAEMYLVWPRVAERWGFASGTSVGVKALFTGEPGTGKTLAAEVIAGHLGLSLVRIDLARVVSKWVGETEKNLDAAFAEAEESSAVLFFDEAEALFGKRGEVRHGTDRYANLEVSFLLQRLERHDGLVILASNLRDEIDPAFVRRFQHVVHFPRPSERERRRLWRLAFPAEAPLAPDVDLGVFARLDLTGAGIVGSARVAALAAARAASESIKIEHIVEAVTGQYQREARALTTTDLGPYASVLRTLNGDATERRAAR